MTQDSPSLSIPRNWTFNSDAVARGFDSHVRETLPWYDLVTGAVALIARHFIGEGGLVYDIGASTGNIGKALRDDLTARKAKLIPIEASEQMAARYDGPQKKNLIIGDAIELDYRPFDVSVLFLTLMFMPPHLRSGYITRLYEACKPGGVIIIVDKEEPRHGFLSTILYRVTLAAKVASGISPEDILAKEVSLGGIQIPISVEEIGHAPVEFFRFGDFAGWIIRKGHTET